jgi:hypothetical protein
MKKPMPHPNEYQTVVESQVFGTVEIGGERRHQRKAASILPVGNTDHQEQENDILFGDDIGQDEHTSSRDGAVETKGVYPTDLYPSKSLFPHVLKRLQALQRRPESKRLQPGRARLQRLFSTVRQHWR